VQLVIIRRLVLAVLVLGMGGLLCELALIAHYEDLSQIIPLALLAAGLTTLGLDMAVARRWSRLVLQLIMVLFIVAGGLGMYFHFRGSREFQIEMDPQIRGAALVWHVLRAKSPPTLAPGSMVQLGMLVLGYAYMRRSK